ncbi:hypothetical protein [Gulosibacter bifidus]|uniref:Uncharacterized protein n=1 Tax=Gulosibacter bifidus TaxID=272239 RepID=A0ABW5RIV1_9MICO|nr:hypothetical protein [Gulosibacter bifidus]
MMLIQSADVTPATRRDAAERGTRTLFQGLAVDILAAIGATVLLVMGSMDDSALLTALGWQTIGVSLLKSVLTAVASWLARLSAPPLSQRGKHAR